MIKTELLEYLDNTISSMVEADIDDAIVLHLELIIENYRRKPFFYKALLKYDRLMVVLSLCSFYYSDNLVPLSKVKQFCEARGYLSRNSLDSYFSFFFISGYMNVQAHPEDARQRTYAPTEMASFEAARLIKSYLHPAMSLAPGAVELFKKTDDEIIRCFFRGLRRLLDANILLDALQPEAKWIINKDGGHLPMLALYVDALKSRSTSKGYKSSTYAQLSSRLCVSSTHVMRLVREGESKGYFKTYGNLVELCPGFTTLVRQTMAINFAVTRISMELGEDATQS